MIKHAKMTFLAYQNLNKSVVKVYPAAIDKFNSNEGALYVGYKNTDLLHPFFTCLDEQKFIRHTIDSATVRGRGIDTNLINPLTLRLMTGSSSASAINVLLGINDVAIATDGGGSVLAPSLSCNLYGFISRVLPIKKVIKSSTDNIEFTVASGLITKKIAIIENILDELQLLPDGENSNNLLFLGEEKNNVLSLKSQSFNHLADRNDLIKILKEVLDKHDFIISYEENIDLEGYGESVHGILNNQVSQSKGNKGLIRACNMIDSTAIVIPSANLSCGYLVICKSEARYFKQLLQIANQLSVKENELIKRYFQPLIENEF